MRRLLLLVYGISLFFWLSVEDVTIGPVVIFGTVGALLMIVLTTLGRPGNIWLTTRFLPLLTAFLGGLTGALTSVTITALMFFKNARHSHIFPDYPPEMMLAILRRAPVWAVAGSLIGLSVGLGWLVWRERREINRQAV